MSRFGARLKSWLTTANRVGTVEGGGLLFRNEPNSAAAKLWHSSMHAQLLHTHTYRSAGPSLSPPKTRRASRATRDRCNLYTQHVIILRATYNIVSFSACVFFFLLFFYLLRMRVLSPKCRSLARTSDSLPGRDDGCAKDTLFIFVVEAPLLFVCLEL